MGRPGRLGERLEELAARVDAGESIPNIAAALGVHRESVRRRVEQLGLETAEQARLRQGVTVLIDEHEWSLPGAAQAYGVPYTTVWTRYRLGYRGRDLVVRRLYPVRAYTLGVSEATWHEYVRLADDVGDRCAADKLGVPVGALRAAVRGELDRLE